MGPIEQTKYELAKKRVAQIKGFYSHLTIYLVINTLLLLNAIGVFNGSLDALYMPHWGYFTTPIFWGIALLFHGLNTFGYNITPIRKWEERKIQQYIEREENEPNIT